MHFIGGISFVRTTALCAGFDIKQQLVTWFDGLCETHEQARQPNFIVVIQYQR